MSFDDNFKTIEEEEFVIKKSSIARNILGFIKHNRNNLIGLKDEVVSAEEMGEVLHITQSTVYDSVVKETITAELVNNSEFGGIITAGFLGINLDGMKEKIEGCIDNVKTAVIAECDKYLESYDYIDKHIDEFASGFGKMIVELVESNYRDFSTAGTENIVEFNFYEAMFAGIDNIAREIGRFDTDEEKSEALKQAFYDFNLSIHSPIFDVLEPIFGDME